MADGRLSFLFASLAEDSVPMRTIVALFNRPRRRVCPWTVPRDRTRSHARGGGVAQLSQAAENRGGARSASSKKAGAS